MAHAKRSAVAWHRPPSHRTPFMARSILPVIAFIVLAPAFAPSAVAQRPAHHVGALGLADRHQPHRACVPAGPRAGRVDPLPDAREILGQGEYTTRRITKLSLPWSYRLFRHAAAWLP